jgi:hypothetical protein
MIREGELRHRYITKKTCLVCKHCYAKQNISSTYLQFTTNTARSRWMSYIFKKHRTAHPIGFLVLILYSGLVDSKHGCPESRSCGCCLFCRIIWFSQWFYFIKEPAPGSLSLRVTHLIQKTRLYSIHAVILVMSPYDIAREAPPHGCAALYFCVSSIRTCKIHFNFIS